MLCRRISAKRQFTGQFTFNKLLTQAFGLVVVPFEDRHIVAQHACDADLIDVFVHIVQVGDDLDY
ncbi:MAG: hypothetical protein DMG76_25660 [Acidobacteria bacterium]|nr:MAG: hypothetical protein DMG76_25660 [Acidobacteriota bacterium]